MTSCLLYLCLSTPLTLDQAAPVMPPPRPVEPAPVDVYVKRVVEYPCPISISNFCCTFQPAPGKYRVLFIHPVKGCPVWVCFELPCGCGTPRVCCSRRQIVFDYGCRGSVVINFKLLFGRVQVLYT
jgi:hypothetical protein